MFTIFLLESPVTDGFRLLIRLIVTSSTKNSGYSFLPDLTVDGITFAVDSVLGIGGSATVYSTEYCNPMNGQCEPFALKVPHIKEYTLTLERKNIEQINGLVRENTFMPYCPKIIFNNQVNNMNVMF